MIRKRGIPVFVVEEHHEAFIVWNFAIQQGWMPASGNCLFHVDEHSDMGTPRFNESIHNLNGDIEMVKDFTYRELNIGSFIMPACYREIFDQVYWIRKKHRKTLHKPVEMFVRSYNQAGKRLLSGKMKHIKKDIPDVDRKSFDYFLRSIDKVPSNKKVILDIDLDYFSCSENPNELEDCKIEITRAEYESFANNRYNRLRYLNLNNRVELYAENDKFYYVFNQYNEKYPSNLKVDEVEIINRINVFLQTINRKRINPFLINICRSGYSMYTPIDQLDIIQNNLMQGLKNIYNIGKVQHINEPLI